MLSFAVHSLITSMITNQADAPRPRIVPDSLAFHWTSSAWGTVIATPESITKRLAILNEASLFSACIHTATREPAAARVEVAPSRITCSARVLDSTAAGTFDSWAWHLPDWYLGYRKNAHAEKDGDVIRRREVHGLNTKTNRWLWSAAG